MKRIRSPNCVFVGHVDHGKSSLLDWIRGTCIVEEEVGYITQSISCSNVSINKIKDVCGDLLKSIKINIPGILFIDTPGHASFTSLRKRGGNIADIAVLVIDIKEGFKPQTIEAIEILKYYKTPFVVALNKIDLITGYQIKNKILLKNINEQADSVKEFLDNKLYETVKNLYDFGFNAERFDKVKDFSKEISIVPVSAKTGDGIPELLMLIMGLAQKFLEESLTIKDEIGRAVILEVKEEKGLGVVLKTILYDGSLNVNDKIVIGGIDKPIVTKIRGLIEEGNKVKEIKASAGVIIIAPDVKDVFSGMPLIVANKDLENVKKEIQEEIEDVLIETDNNGVVVKADSIGSLEALINLLKSENIEIKKASIGEINKKDIADAKSDKEDVNKVVLGFNIKTVTSDVKVIVSDIIYKIVEDYKKCKDEKKKDIELKKLEKIERPFKLKILPHCIFRQSNPAVFGVDVLNGFLKTNVKLMKDDGSKLKEVKSIQLDGKNINEVERGKQVAIAVDTIVGRHVFEDDILYSDVSEENFKKLKDMKKLLNKDEIEILKEIAEIKRKENIVWGV